MFWRISSSYTLAILSIITTPPAVSEEFSFAIGEWPPFISSNAPGYGLHSELISEIFGSQGHTVKLEFYPWRRSLELTKVGTLPATYSWSYLQEREDDFIYPEHPLDQLNDVNFYRKDRFPNGLAPLSFDELKGRSLTVVGVEGYWYETVLNKAGVVFQTAATEEQAWKMLLHNRADIFIENDVSGDIQGRQFLGNDMDEIDRSAPFRTIPVYIMFSRHNPDAHRIMEIWDTGITELLDSGPDSRIQ
jgi:polar amino acid transport system substrate-binding protein